MRKNEASLISGISKNHGIRLRKQFLMRSSLGCSIIKQLKTKIMKTLALTFLLAINSIQFSFAQNDPNINQVVV
ncbi:MAG: hypothetical protein DWP98_09160, partial [Bacteroidetes bacterium]